ncbi:twin-arginine translocase subunit TatC, partial [Thermus scotoductus]
MLWSLLTWVVGTGVAWSFRVQILEWLKRPLDLAAQQHHIQVNLIVLAITEPFLVSLKVAAFGGLVLALPF